jgi:hypothetical protein
MTDVRHWRALAALSLLLGCEANITGPSGSASLGDGGPVTPPTGQSDTPPLVGPSDDELREKDPELFEVAQRYFPGETPKAGRKRMFRLTRQQLDLTTQNLLPKAYGASALGVLPRDPLQTNYEYADNLSFTAASFTPFTQWTDELATRVKADPRSVIDCAEADSACARGGARELVRRAFRGVVGDATLERFANLFEQSVKQVGFAQAVADLVSVTLTAPGYVFREEVQTEPGGRLRAAQLLQHLSYTLADSPPDALGLTLPTSGDRAPTNEELGALARRILVTPAARAKLLRFFSAWLELREPQDFDISTQAFPELTPEVAAAMVDDTRRFLAQQLGTPSPRLRDLTEAEHALVSAPSAFLYGLDAAPPDGKHTPSPAERLGIFSQPAVVASHSGPTTTRLVKRGVFFTRKVMCLPLGVPPADVNTSIPEDVTGTERERIEGVTQEARCLGCHSFINPFGFMQENYDPIGRYRSLDAGKPVDASISVTFLDEGPLTAQTPVEALRGFTRSLRFQQCFTRQLFRFYTGRDETPGDDPLLRRLFFEFARDGSQGITALLEGLASEPSYSSRSEAP